MSNRRILFYVQHLLGIGHLKRAATLCRAMSAAGMDVTLISGGGNVPGLNIGGADFIQLPPTRATDLYFKKLVDENDQPIDDDWKARRREQLLEARSEFDPHVLMIELFPFGRRQMRFELDPLLDAAIVANHRPVIVSSVRDILVAQEKAERNDEMLARVEKYFDHILVHGDADFIALDKTFSHAAQIKEKIYYTGYVVDRTARVSPDRESGRDEVIVSAGGGAVGLEFLKFSIAAREISTLADRTWRILVGYNLPQEYFDQLVALAAHAGGGVIVERARADFPVLLRNCALSLSQGGYNTMMETLEAGAHAVIVPYAGGIETEQTLRARGIGERGGITILDEADLAPDSIGAAIATAIATPPAHVTKLDTDGDTVTVDLVAGWAGSRAWD
jgi:predicted glycosyltransferase